MLAVAVGYKKRSSKDVVRENYSWFEENIYPNDILDDLIAKDILKGRQAEIIHTLRQNHKAVDIIIKEVIRMSEKDPSVADDFLDIIEARCQGTRSRLEQNVRRKDSKDFQRTYDLDRFKRDLDSNYDKFVEKIDPDSVANMMFEDGGLGAYEHDKIIHDERTSFRAKELMNIVCAEKKRLSSFHAALQKSKQMHLLLSDTAEGTESMETEESLKVNISTPFSCADSRFCGNGQITRMEVESVFETSDMEGIEETIIGTFKIPTTEKVCEVETYTARYLDFTIDGVSSGSLHICLMPLSTKPKKEIFEILAKDGLPKLFILLLSLPDVRAHLQSGKFNIRSKIKIQYGKPDADISSQDESSFLSMVPYVADKCSRSFVLKKLSQNTDVPDDALLELERTSVDETRPKGTLMILRQMFESKRIPLHIINASLKDALGKKDADGIVDLCPYCVKRQILDNFDFLIKEMDSRSMIFFYHVITIFAGYSLDNRNLTQGCRMQRARRVLLVALRNNDHVVFLAHVLIIHGLDTWLQKRPCSKLAEGCCTKKVSFANRRKCKGVFEMDTTLTCSYSVPKEVQMKRKINKPDDEGYCSIELKSRTVEEAVDTDMEPFVIVDYSESCHNIGDK